MGVTERAERGSAGKVFLVGAGPGDPGLITVKGREYISQADVIVCDHLASKSLLAYARTGVELIDAGKEGSAHTLSQEAIARLLVEKAREGKKVVRLKGGDPFVFGRGGEEAEVLVEAGIPFEVVPGISSAVAAPAYAGIPITHRSYTSSVAIITGHEDPNKEESSIPWKALAQMGTVACLMGVKNLEKNTRALIDNGAEPQTPVALIRWGTTARQETLTGTLQDIAEKARTRGLRPPVVMVVGGVVNLRDRLNWFETRPLFGKRIVVTRAREQASDFAAALDELGAEVVEFPTIEILPPESWDDLDTAIQNLDRYDWLIFTSVNAVTALLERLQVLGKDIRGLKGLKICAIGPQTASAISEKGVRLDFVPKEYRAEAIIEGMKKEVLQGASILIPRAKIAREVLPEELRLLGAKVTVAEAYRTELPQGDTSSIKELLEQKKIDMVTFTSSSTVKNFAAMFSSDDFGKLMEGVTVASIGPITSDTASEQGLEVHVMPAEYTIAALVDAIMDYFQKGG